MVDGIGPESVNHGWDGGRDGHVQKSLHPPFVPIRVTLLVNYDHFMTCCPSLRFLLSPTSIRLSLMPNVLFSLSPISQRHSHSPPPSSHLNRNDRLCSSVYVLLLYRLQNTPLSIFLQYLTHVSLTNTLS